MRPAVCDSAGGASGVKPPVAGQLGGGGAVFRGLSAVCPNEKAPAELGNEPPAE